jgi:intergrase/recombinase
MSHEVKTLSDLQPLEMGINCNMRFCHKTHASWLRQSRVESEIMDLLQGHVPKSVFARHYFMPSLAYQEKVLYALDKLKKEIEKER